MGEWVIDRVLQQISLWKAQEINLVVSINVSAAHLLHPGFSSYMDSCLKRYPDVSSSDLELEILESATITDLKQASQVLADGGSMGLRFSLDDFGTGYSSLSYFNKLQIDTLKIDQEFVRNMLNDPEDLSVVESVVFLAQAFNRSVIAEGVETPQHYAMLLRLGCPFGQGFGIAEPMPAGHLGACLRARNDNPAHQQQKLIELPREDLVLVVAAASHRSWVDQVGAFVEGTNDEPPPMNPHQCRFGRWYHGIGHSRYSALAEYTALDPLHQWIHERAASLVGLVKQGLRESAKAGMPELCAMRDEFLSRLDSLISRLQRQAREDKLQD